MNGVELTRELTQFQSRKADSKLILRLRCSVYHMDVQRAGSLISTPFVHSQLYLTIRTTYILQIVEKTTVDHCRSFQWRGIVKCDDGDFYISYSLVPVFRRPWPPEELLQSIDLDASENTYSCRRASYDKKRNTNGVPYQVAFSSCFQEALSTAKAMVIALATTASLIHRALG